jgi:hypothetical protein
MPARAGNSTEMAQMLGRINFKKQQAKGLDRLLKRLLLRNKELGIYI